MLNQKNLEKYIEIFNNYLFNEQLNFIPKTIVNLKGDLICSERIVVMPAEIKGIGKSVKTLYIDDKKNKRVGILECFFDDGRHETFDGNLITTYRTILITILVLKKINMLNDKKICVVGKNGRIGSELIKNLNYYSHNIYGIGRTDNQIPDCDVLISCSSNYHKTKLRKLPIIDLIVMLDSGYQFIYEPNKFEIFGDNIKSLNKNTKLEFPFYTMEKFEKTIFSHNFVNTKSKKIAYIVGDGIFDLLMAYIVANNHFEWDL
jgi:hypothetical protein